MRFGCYSLKMIQHGCQSCTASPTHEADAHILHAACQQSCTLCVLDACYLLLPCHLYFLFWALLHYT